MAFNFLAALPAILSAVSSIPSFLNAFSRRDPMQDNPMIALMMHRLQKAEKLGRAAVDPTSKIHMAASAFHEEELRRKAVEGVLEQAMEMRRARAMGNIQAGVIPERRDEARSRSLAEAFMAASRIGDEMATEQIATAANQASANIQSVSPLVDVFSQAVEANAANRTLGLQALGRVPNALLDIFNTMFQGGGAEPSAAESIFPRPSFAGGPSFSRPSYMTH